MLGEFQLLGEELKRDITVLQETSSLKTAQLDETRKKLREEIVEHQTVRNCLDKSMDEMDKLKLELSLNEKANAKLEESNAKHRETLAKFQSQKDLRDAEKQVLTDRCHKADIEICKLKNQLADVEIQLQENLVYKERYVKYQSDTKNLIDQILSKMEILVKEQERLEKSVKDGLDIVKELSDERNLQSLFVKEANITRIRLENETMRLIGVLEVERNEKQRLLESLSEKEPKKYYLDDWKSSQEEMRKRIRYLTEENEKLMDQVELLKVQVDVLMEKEL